MLVRNVMGQQISATARSMLGVMLACLALISGLLASAPIAHAASATILYTQPPCAPVYTAPSRQSLLITQLLGGTDVAATGEGDASGWTHVRIWSGIDGYVPSSLLGAQQPEHPREGVCTYPGLSAAVAEDPPADTGPAPLNAKGVTIVATPLYAQPDANSQQVATLAQGQAISISQWAVGPGGQPWYQVSANGKSGWIWSAKVKLSIADPAKRQVNGQPIWRPIAGKGMWFTNYLPHHSDVDQMMRAAKL
ncbi:MAG TPA: SH3 domain-containing protein, partial [Ktedonobacterales bacterium]